MRSANFLASTLELSVPLGELSNCHLNIKQLKSIHFNCTIHHERKLLRLKSNLISLHFLTHQIGRILFAVPFLGFGISHLMRGSDMAAILPTWLPGNEIIYVYITGALQILAAIAIIIKKYDYQAALGLAALTLLIVLIVHLPAFSNGPTGQIVMANALKDIALAGAALLYAGTKMK
jgi:putative oxidoreductase